MASQENDLSNITAAEWEASDADITELLSKLIDGASEAYEAHQIGNEVANIPPEMFLPYDGQLLDDCHYCSLCPKKFKHKKNLNRHLRNAHHIEARAKRPRKAGEKENTPPAKKQKTKDQMGGGEVDENEEENEEEKTGDHTGVESAIGDNLKVYKMAPNKNEKYDLSLTLQRKKRYITRNLQKELQKKKGIKWFLCAQVKMVKTSVDGDEFSSPHFRSLSITTLTADPGSSI